MRPHHLYVGAEHHYSGDRIGPPIWGINPIKMPQCSHGVGAFTRYNDDAQVLGERNNDHRVYCFMCCARSGLRQIYSLWSASEMLRHNDC